MSLVSAFQAIQQRQRDNGRRTAGPVLSRANEIRQANQVPNIAGQQRQTKVAAAPPTPKRRGR